MVTGKLQPGPSEYLAAYAELTQAAEQLALRLAARLREANLRLSQLGVLETLLHFGPQNQRALGARLKRSGGNVTMVVDNLEKRGLVKRTRSPGDRRAYIISLTSDGRNLVEEVFPEHAQRVAEEFAHLSNEEVNLLRDLCRRLAGTDNVATSRSTS